MNLLPTVWNTQTFDWMYEIEMDGWDLWVLKWGRAVTLMFRQICSNRHTYFPFPIYNLQKSQVGQAGDVGCILFSITIFRLASHPVAPHTTRGEFGDSKAGFWKQGISWTPWGDSTTPDQDHHSNGYLSYLATLRLANPRTWYMTL